MATSAKYRESTDDFLLHQIARQDSEALEEIYDRYAQITYNLIARIVRDRAVADELLQETFWQVWQKAAGYAGQGAVAAWLYRIARNKSLDQLRRQKARPQPVWSPNPETEEALWSRLTSDGMPVERSTEQRWERETVSQALARIPEEQRRCLELVYFEGMSQRQIAEYTDTPLGTVKTRLRIGLEKLERIFRAAGYRVEDIT